MTESDEEHGRFLACLLAHQQDLRAYCFAVLRDWHACDDAVQDIALVLWRRWSDYDPARPFGGWARGVARHVLLEYGRRRWRQPALLDEAALVAIEAAFDQQPAPPEDHRQEALRRCLQQLGARGRRLLHLRYHEDQDLPAIAAALASSYQAVKKALFRSRVRLQDCVRQRLQAEGAGHG